MWSCAAAGFIWNTPITSNNSCGITLQSCLITQRCSPHCIQLACRIPGTAWHHFHVNCMHTVQDKQKGDLRDVPLNCSMICVVDEGVAPAPAFWAVANLSVVSDIKTLLSIALMAADGILFELIAFSLAIVLSHALSHAHTTPATHFKNQHLQHVSLKHVVPPLFSTCSKEFAPPHHRGRVKTLQWIRKKLGAWWNKSNF